jgi:hypothetical protein
MILVLTLLNFAGRAGDEMAAAVIAFLLFLMVVLGGLLLYFLPTFIACQF